MSIPLATERVSVLILRPRTTCRGRAITCRYKLPIKPPTIYSFATVVVIDWLYHGLTGPRATPSTAAVPEHVAVPLLAVAENAVPVQVPVPPLVTVRAVPLAIVFVPVRGTVAVAPVQLLLNDGQVAGLRGRSRRRDPAGVCSAVQGYIGSGALV